MKQKQKDFVTKMGDFFFWHVFREAHTGLFYIRALVFVAAENFECGNQVNRFLEAVNLLYLFVSYFQNASFLYVMLSAADEMIKPL